MHRDPRPPHDLPADVVEALSQGKKIEAIKRLRAVRSMGLKDAKDMVDAYAATDPVVQARLERVDAESKRTLMTYVGLFFGLLIGILIFMRARH
jgi:ribosomal protein L7/L12